MIKENFLEIVFRFLTSTKPQAVIINPEVETLQMRIGLEIEMDAIVFFNSFVRSFVYDPFRSFFSVVQ